jgi:Phage tail lysozyme
MILLLLFMSVAEAPGLPTPLPCPITVELKDQLHPKDSRARVACDVERQLRTAGWKDPLIAGALANAWHESGWNPEAVGPGGGAVGFWQLHEDGLGHGMGAKRLNARKATARIIRFTDKQKLTTRHFRTPGQAADIFCRKVMRPGNADIHGRKRARTADIVN